MATRGLESAPSARLAADAYVQRVLRLLESPALYRGTPEASLALQRELLPDFLAFFLRHDRDGYYHGLYDRKGLLDDRGALRADVALEDLVRLRIHSDDLRGSGQRRRLVVGAGEDGKVMTSSGTTGNSEGPVTISRSALTLHAMHVGMGRQMEWAVGHPVEGVATLMFATPWMAENVALPTVVKGAFELLGASEVVLGARLREDPVERNPWRLLEPDPAALERFLGAPGADKVAMVPAGAIALLLAAGARWDLGAGGALITGGGLKQKGQFETMSALLAAARSAFTAGAEPAPVSDVLGLTETAAIFPSLAGDPADERTWIKVPSPLTWVGMLESPQRLELVDAAETGYERLLFFVNFMCFDYLEAIVPGDVVARAHTPEHHQHGFVYVRRAAADEGFKIREGCG